MEWAGTLRWVTGGAWRLRPGRIGRDPDPVASREVSTARSARPHVRRRTAAGSVALILLGLAVSLVHGQVFEGHIQLPDSLSLITGISTLTISPDGRFAYISASEGSDVTVIDVAAARKVARLHFGFYWARPVPIRSTNRMFVVRQDSLTVLDCRDNSIVRTTRVGSGWIDLCENLNGVKVYALDQNRDTLYVLDALTGGRHGARAVNHAPMLFNQPRNELYVIGDVPDSISVFDGAGDTLVRRFYLAGAGEPAVLLPRLNKLYVASGDSLIALDCATGARVGAIRRRSTLAPLVNPKSNRLYWATDDHYRSVWMYDCNGDTLLKRAHLRDSLEADDIALGCIDTLQEKLYLLVCEPGIINRLAVLDASNLGIRSTVEVTNGPTLACYDGPARMVLCTGSGGALVGVDVVTDAEAMRVSLVAGASFLCYNPVYDKLYAFYGDNLGLATIIDCRTSRTTGIIWLGSGPHSAAADAVSGKVYCTFGGEDSIAVIDGAADTVLYKRWCVPAGGAACVSTPVGRKVYAATGTGGGRLFVFDAERDSLTSIVPAPPSPSWVLHGSPNNLVYSIQYLAGVHAVDVTADTVVAYRPAVPGGEFHDLVFAANVNKLFLGGNGDSVFVLDGVSLDVIRKIGHARTVDGTCLAYSPAELKLIGSVWSCDSVFIADAQSDSVVKTLHVGARPLWIQVDWRGRYAYVARATDAVSVIDLTRDSVVTEFESVAVGWPECSPASRRVYFGSSGRVSVFGDSTTAIGETSFLSRRGRVAGPAVPRLGGTLTLEGKTRVIDATGRQRAVLEPGERRLDGLPAGVYFLRSVAGGAPRRLLLVR
jgi:DNA-binding beta-propeller fold protein YncE